MLQRLGHLAVAVAFERVELLVEQVQWSRVAFSSRQVHDTDVVESMHALRDVLAEQLPKQAMVACRMVDLALERVAGTAVPQPSSLLNATGGDSTAARLYLLHLLERNRDRAWHVVHGARLSGRSLAQVYERILVPSMAEVGRMWHMQEASIADEHYCTAATQAIMARLRGQARRKPATGLVAVACSAGGDMHELGIRMVSDLLDVEGWHVECLGANMPSHEVAAVAGAQPHRGPADVIAVSAGTPLAIRSVAHLIRTVKEEGQAPDAAFMVGGMPFNMVPDLWKVVGADGFSASAIEAPRVAADLARARRSHARS